MGSSLRVGGGEFLVMGFNTPLSHSAIYAHISSKGMSFARQCRFTSRIYAVVAMESPFFLLRGVLSQQTVGSLKGLHRVHCGHGCSGRKDTIINSLVATISNDARGQDYASILSWLTASDIRKFLSANTCRSTIAPMGNSKSDLIASFVARDILLDSGATPSSSSSAPAAVSTTTPPAASTLGDPPAAVCDIVVFDPIPYRKKRKKLTKLWSRLAKLARRQSLSRNIRAAMADVCKDKSLTVSEIKQIVECETHISFSENRMAHVFFDKQIQKCIDMKNKRRKRRRTSRVLNVDLSHGNPLAEFYACQAMQFEDDLSSAVRSETRE